MQDIGLIMIYKFCFKCF